MKRYATYCFSLLVILITIGGMSTGCRASSKDSTDFADARRHMIKTQLEARGISDKKVLKAFETVARHKFVPPARQSEAYNDSPLPIGEGQTISQPYIVALMTELLHLERNDKVLEIGTGSGYQAAILGELVDSVFTIEIIEDLGNRAKGLLEEMGYRNIFVKIGDGYKGWPEHAPFDAIIVTCAPDKIPEALIEQLAEGGQMVIPVGGDIYQELILVKKQEGKIIKESVAPVMFVPMTGESSKQK